MRGGEKEGASAVIEVVYEVATAADVAAKRADSF